jgi:U3 small nucleolar RNA-associated protein 12
MFDEDPSKNRREEQATANILDRKGRSDAGGDGDEMKEDEPQSEEAVKQSILSINAGDRLLEALELADQELQAARSKNKKGATVNPMLLGMDPPHYVLWVLKSIKSADLEQALLVLPLGHAERLLYYLVLLLKEGPRSVELCCRAAVFTFKCHQQQVRASFPNCCFI